MRRTAMKRKRKTPRGQNSDIVKAYKLENADCEWALQFPGIETWIGRPTDMRTFMKRECHHIFGRKNGDHPSGLITLSKYCHDWAHGNGYAGHILSMLVKCRKGEADIAFWTNASGKYIETWVESLGDFYCAGDWMRPYWEELVSRLKGIA